MTRIWQKALDETTVSVLNIWEIFVEVNLQLYFCCCHNKQKITNFNK
jgi:hypothetical protein